MISLEAPYVLFLGDVADRSDAKTAFGIVHWCPDKCVGQIRLTASAVDLGLPDMAVDAVKASGARTVIIGIANFGGFIDPLWVPTLARLLAAGIDLAAGLHSRLGDVPELVEASRIGASRIHDIRQPSRSFPVASGRKRSGQRLLTVGTDCAVGKKYTALAVARELQRRGLDASFCATGQTGIFIVGTGVCIDAVIADFISGAAETLSPASDPQHWAVIEGQGSLFHPAYAGVALGLLHGSQPDALIICHEAGRDRISGYEQFEVPTLERCAADNIAAAKLTNPEVRVAGYSINTAALDQATAQRHVAQLAARLGNPVTDPVRFGVGALVDSLLQTDQEAETSSLARFRAGQTV